MTTGQFESYVATVFSFGHRTTIPAGTSTYLAMTGGTNQAAEITTVIPRDGVLTNLCWDCQTNGLTGTGNQFTVKIGAVHVTPTSAAPALTNGLVVSMDGNTNGSQSMNIPVVAGQRVGVLVQTVAGGTSISRLRVSFELETQRTSPTWQMDTDGSTVFYDGGNVGIGTTMPGEALSVDGVIESETGGFKFPDGSVQTTAAFGGGTTSEITEADGKVGIGIDPTRNAQERLTLGPASAIAVEMPTPEGVTAAVSPTAGGLAADDYYFRVAASDGAGWTKAADQLRFDLTDDTYGIRISWDPVPGATKYRVFRALTAAGAYKYIETTNAYYDYINDSSFTVKGAPPEETTAYMNKLSPEGASWMLGGNVGIGTASPQTKLDVAGAISGFGIVPLGSVIAWHKSLAGTPGLPSGWVECNGQVLNNPLSPYNGETIPNLNIAPPNYAGGRFLRGGIISGTMQEATKHHALHSNSDNIGALYFSQGVSKNAVYDNDGTPGNFQSPMGALQGGSTTWVADSQFASRPLNMSVVYIMRVQ